MFESFKNLQKINLDDLYNLFLGLEKKQQILAVVLVVLFFLGALRLPYRFLNQKISDLQEQYDVYRNNVKDLSDALSEYKVMQSLFSKSTQNSSEDSLSALIYNLAETYGIPKKKVSLKSVGKVMQGDLFEQDGKDVEIKSVPLDQLMRMLGGLETSSQMPTAIKKLDLKVDKKNKQVMSQATFTVMTLKARK